MSLQTEYTENPLQDLDRFSSVEMMDSQWKQAL